jgi:hypothetical protein
LAPSFREETQREMTTLLPRLQAELYATQGTKEWLADMGLVAQGLFKVHVPREPNILTLLRRGELDLVITTPPSCSTFDASEFDEPMSVMLNACLEKGIPCVADPRHAVILLQALYEKDAPQGRDFAWTRGVHQSSGQF